MGCVKTCTLCGGCVTEGTATETSMSSVKENAIVERLPEDSESTAPTSGLPDIVLSCPRAARFFSSCESSTSSPALCPGAVKLTGRKLRYLSDHFAGRVHKVHTQCNPTNSWFETFLRACASTVHVLWKPSR